MQRLGIAFSGGVSPAETVDCVKLAEELGYKSAWVAEGHGGDQFATLAACATQTTTILLGTAITSVFVRIGADDRDGRGHARRYFPREVHSRRRFEP